MLCLKNIVIAGDLNVTMSVGKIWGGSASSRQLAAYFISLFQDHKLIDLQPDKLVPTWRNVRLGGDMNSKRLDSFLISEDLFHNVTLYKTWVEFPYVSDHALIILQLENSSLPKSYNFKFHSQWL